MKLFFLYNYNSSVIFRSRKDAKLVPQ